LDRREQTVPPPGFLTQHKERTFDRGDGRERMGVEVGEQPYEGVVGTQQRRGALWIASGQVPRANQLLQIDAREVDVPHRGSRLRGGCCFGLCIHAT
jgi:hypothetical protein